MGFAKGAGYFIVLAALLWIVSYQTSGPIYTMPQWQWFAAVSVTTMIAAVATSVGAAVCFGIWLTNPEPLPGSNH